jgi:Pvc16 N-terminal domain
LTGALAIASVTAVLKDLLGNGIVKYSGPTGLGDVSLSVLPPDRMAAGADERTHLNLFMYRVAPYTSLPKMEKGQSICRSGVNGAAPSLALELSYLLSACGAEEFQAEILLGCAMQLLHETPVLTPDRIRAALGSSLPENARNLMPPVRSALSACTIADQVQQIRITPQFLSFDELSKLWQALQSRYRPSLAYQVSAVVLRKEDPRPVAMSKGA